MPTATAEPTVAPTEPAAFEPVTVTDMLGREVTITEPVERIAYTHYSTAQALKILDAWDMVVAKDGWTSDTFLYPNINDIPPLTPMGENYNPDLELLLSLDLDLLILEVIPVPGMEELMAALEGKVPVVTVRTYDPETLTESLNTLAALLGKEDEAQVYIAWYTDVMDTLESATAGLTEDEKPRYFYKTGWGDADDIMTFTDEMNVVPFRNRVTGSVNVAADLPSMGGWVQAVDPEWLVTQEIDVLLVLDPVPGAFGFTVDDPAIAEAHWQQIVDLAAFAGSDAVQNGRVYCMADTFFGTPTSTVGFAYMAKLLHPDLFADLDPQALHQEYLTRFLRVDIDLDEQGLFVYP
jgi:iron complex transport system substrate-binding protein